MGISINFTNSDCCVHSFTSIVIVLGESYVHIYDVVPTQTQRL